MFFILLEARYVFSTVLSFGFELFINVFASWDNFLWKTFELHFRIYKIHKLHWEPVRTSAYY